MYLLRGKKPWCKKYDSKLCNRCHKMDGNASMSLLRTYEQTKTKNYFPIIIYLLYTMTFAFESVTPRTKIYLVETIH